MSEEVKVEIPKEEKAAVKVEAKKEGKKGTQFSLRLFPVGGFCAMEGEEEESDDPNSLSRQSV